MIKRKNEKVIFQTGLFTIKDILLDSDGKNVTYQIMEKGDTAIIVPLTSDNQLILIKEYFTALDEYQLDLPGGRIEAGKTALETASKELQEEVGFKAEKIELLGVLTMSPGYLTQKAHIFLATDLKESKLEGDELESLEIIKYPFDKFEDLIDNGQITESRAIAALYLAKRALQK